MKIHLVSFYNTGHREVFKQGSEQLRNSYLNAGCDTFTCYTEETLKLTDKELEFMKNNERGFGFWAWKPIVILQKLYEIDEGDMVLYHDCGRTVYNYKLTENLKPLAELVNKEYGGIGVALSHWHHKEYTKTECFGKMQCTEDFYKNSYQAIATWHFWKKQPLSFDLLYSWKLWNFDDSEIITDKGAEKENQPEGFHGHRHDQSILTNLILKFSTLHENIKPILQPESFWEKNINTWVQKLT